jgi:hypothetical protein
MISVNPFIRTVQMTAYRGTKICRIYDVVFAPPRPRLPATLVTAAAAAVPETPLTRGGAGVFFIAEDDEEEDDEDDDEDAPDDEDVNIELGETHKGANVLPCLVHNMAIQVAVSEVTSYVREISRIIRNRKEKYDKRSMFLPLHESQPSLQG